MTRRRHGAFLAAQARPFVDLSGQRAAGHATCSSPRPSAETLPLPLSSRKRRKPIRCTQTRGPACSVGVRPAMLWVMPSPHPSDAFMSGDRLGLLALRWDAVYCVVMGIALAVLCVPIGSWTGAPSAVVAAAGVFVIVGGVAVGWMSSSLDRAHALRIVLSANVIATAALVTTSAAATGVLLTLTAIVIAIDVGAFAAGQAIALRRLRHH